VISDTERDCLYALTSKSSISIHKPNGDKALQHVQTISNLYKAAQDKAPGSPALTPQTFQVISLHIVDESESRSGVQLLAMTSNGVRLYFSPSNSFSYTYGSARNVTSGVRSLQLIHVRLPPSNLRHPDEVSNPYHPTITAYGPSHAPPQTTVRPYVVTSIENSYYRHGLTIAAQQGDTDGTDYILCMAPDLTRIGTFGQLNLPQQQQSRQQQSVYSYGSPNTSRPPLTEYATLLAIPGRTWAMAMVPHTAAISTLPGVPAPAITNELATQFNEPPRQFMLLTNVGLTFLIKRRAMDYLKAALEELQSEGNVQPIIEFRDR
jgi:nuclear pore complex protein Nup155